MDNINTVETSNTRIRELPDFPGAKIEAIATGINIDYKPVTPLDTTVVLGYQDFVTNEAGEPIPFTAPGLTPIHLSLGELIDICGEQVDIPQMMADLRVVADLVHNARYANMGDTPTPTPTPDPEQPPAEGGEPEPEPEPEQPPAEGGEPEPVDDPV